MSQNITIKDIKAESIMLAKKVVKDAQEENNKLLEEINKLREERNQCYKTLGQEIQDDVNYIEEEEKNNILHQSKVNQIMSDSRLNKLLTGQVRKEIEEERNTLVKKKDDLLIEVSELKFKIENKTEDKIQPCKNSEIEEYKLHIEKLQNKLKDTETQLQNTQKELMDLQKKCIQILEREDKIARSANNDTQILVGDIQRVDNSDLQKSSLILDLQGKIRELLINQSGMVCAVQQFMSNLLQMAPSMSNAIYEEFQDTMSPYFTYDDSLQDQDYDEQLERGYRPIYDQYGYDQYGYDEYGYNRRGYNKYGYNQYGYNKDGLDENGLDEEGYDIDGYDVDGYDRQGFNRQGYNGNGFNRQGQYNKQFDMRISNYNQKSDEEQQNTTWVFKGRGGVNHKTGFH